MKTYVFSQSRMRWPAAVLGATMAFWMLPGLARAQSFSASLDQCKAVTVPNTLANCAAAQDPLKRGIVAISDQGDVTVTITGAATNATYAVSIVSGDGSQATSLGNLTTDNHGDGAFRKNAFFKFGAVGAGNVVLSSGGAEEFVSGLSISTNGLESGPDFQPGLVRCTDVVVPGALSNCGSDSLTAGHVDVENDDGALSIHVHGARPNTTYTAIFRSPNSATTTPIGIVGPTSKAGDATLDLGAGTFAAGTVGSGSIVLQSGGTDEFVSGFKVNERFVRPAVSESNLVPCDDVTDPDDLVCGSDPLDKGSYEVNAAGQVSVSLTGADPSTNYELFLRPLDNSGDVDTGIALATNALGNVQKGPKAFFPADAVASGTFVVKRQDSETEDQFVSGYKLN